MNVDEPYQGKELVRVENTIEEQVFEMNNDLLMNRKLYMKQ